MKPDMFKKLPPEISRRYNFIISLYFRHDGKNLFPFYRPFFFSLGIADNAEAAILDFADTVNDILSVGTLIKYDIADFQITVRCFEIYNVPAVTQKRGHAAPADDHIYLVTFFNKAFQHRDIFICIYLHHISPFPVNSSFKTSDSVLRNCACKMIDRDLRDEIFNKIHILLYEKAVPCVYRYLTVKLRKCFKRG